jgi:hypothetical protein
MVNDEGTNGSDFVASGSLGVTFGKPEGRGAMNRAPYKPAFF